MIQKILFVFIGGGLGSVLRFLISKHFNSSFDNFFVGTFLVNAIGCLLIGFFIGLEVKYLMNKPEFFLLVAGFCGGFTTFSAFALENYTLFRAGDYSAALFYIIISLIIGILAVALGFYFARQLFN
jgi:CrcB protein